MLSTMHRLASFVACLFVLQCVSAADGNFLNWLWNKNDNEESDLSDRKVRDGVTMPEVPFETLSTDERFLQEAQHFGLAAISQLDSCQQAVVLRLRSSCSSLTEEQLAKFSVSLLNCQSAAEGRQQFPCSDDMTLRQCTGDMDPDTWNTYHLMNNRARAVCLASRQAQFRVLTEMTVNKLMATSKGQLDAMDALQHGQERLGALTEGTLRSVSEGQNSLLLQQQHLRAAQRNAHSFVSHSLREMAREKSLIAAGHRELSRLVQSIKIKLDDAGKDLQLQNSDRQQQHGQLLSDLQNIQSQAADIWKDIDLSTKEILARNELALQHYSQTLESLKAINSSIIYLQSMLDATRKEVDQRLGWIADTLGGAGGQLDLVIACLMHLGFLLLSMLTIAFLKAPMCSRVLLVLLVALNIIQLVLQGPDSSLSLPATALLIVIGTAVHKLIHGLSIMLFPPQTTPLPSIAAVQRQRVNGGVTPLRETSSFFEKMTKSAGGVWIRSQQFFGAGNSSTISTSNTDVAAEESESSDESDSGLPEELPRRSEFLPAHLRRDESREPSLSRRSRSGTPRTPSRPSTPRHQCKGICVNGQPCRVPVTSENGLCFRHSRQTSNTPR